MFKDGKFTVAGTDKSVGWGDVTLNAYIAHKFTGAQLEPGLKEGAFYDPTNFTFPAGCHICEVEIDPDTGHVDIAGWTAVDDFGTVINPMIVEGQVHGGVAQGVGQALLEGAVYDTNGQLVSGSFMDYSMPRAENLPDAQGRHHHHEMPVQPARHQGLRRGGRDRGSGGGHQRHHRRDRQRRFGHAGDAPGGLGGDPQGREDATRSRIGITGRPRCTNSNITRPNYGPAGGQHAGQGSGGEAPRGRPFAAAGDEAAARQAHPASRPRPDRGPHQHRAQGPFARDRRDGAPRRGGELAGREGGAAGCWPSSPARSAIRRCATAAPSAARSPTTIRTPTIRRRCWASAPPSSPTSARSRPTISSRACSTTALEPDEIITKVSFPLAKKAAYKKFKHPASGFALVGVFVSKRGVRHPRRGDRRGLERRVPRRRASRRR